MRERRRRDEPAERAAEALRESERRLKTLMDNLPGMAYRCLNVPEWPMQFVSEGCFDLTGYTPKELTIGGGIDYGDLIHADDRQAVYDAVQEGVRTGTSFRMEYRIVKKSGEVRDVWEQGRLVSEPGDPTEWLEGFITDVTERKRGTYSTALLARLTETSPIGIALLDLDGRMTFANAAAVDVLGLDRERLAGRRYDDASWRITDAAGEPLPNEEVPFVRVLRTGRTVHDAEVGIRRADRRILLSVNAAPLDDGSGKIAGVVVIFRDVTQERETERQLLQAQKMDAVGRLAGGVAHDFNNLLTAIQGYAEMLSPQLSPGSSADRYLAEIRKAAVGAGELTKQLLAFGRKQILQPSVLDLNAVVGSMVNLIRRVIGEDVDLVRSLDPALPAVRADRGQLEQVLMNLCINARDAMPEGGRLSIETRGTVADGRRSVLLRVSDTGTGMTPEVQAKIFEPFFSTKAPDKGTGLGLATVYGIVQQSGGDIRVESAPGAGARFEIRLPAAEAEAEHEEGAIATEGEFAARGETVLVVEDEDAIRDLLRDVLSDWGYTVLDAGTPRDALEMLARHDGTVDLLLTDVVLPEMNGPQLATRVETLRPGIRVLFMSGYTDDAVFRHGVLGESAHFLPKPFAPAALKKKIREVLEG
jgi:PAS domain S-box-containing protein